MKNDDDDDNDGSWMAGECHMPYNHEHATHFECAMLTFLFFLYCSFYRSYIIIYYLFPSLNVHVKSDRNNEGMWYWFERLRKIQF